MINERRAANALAQQDVLKRQERREVYDFLGSVKGISKPDYQKSAPKPNWSALGIKEMLYANPYTLAGKATVDLVGGMLSKPVAPAQPILLNSTPKPAVDLSMSQPASNPIPEPALAITSRGQNKPRKGMGLMDEIE